MASPPSPPEFIYKIASASAWRDFAATGRFAGMPIDIKDGYVHFSTAAQLAETLRLHFAGQSDLVIFAVRTRDLGAALRWEPSRGGQLFPHLYGTLTTASLGEVADCVAVAADGGVILPGWVR